MDWELLGGEPVPGDPAAIRALSESLLQRSQEAHDALAQADRVAFSVPDAGWEGAAADAFVGAFSTFGPQLRAMGDALQNVGAALAQHASRVEALQQSAEQTLERAEEAQRLIEEAEQALTEGEPALRNLRSSWESARNWADSARFQAEQLQAAGDPAAIEAWDTYQDLALEARELEQRVTVAEAEVAAAREALEQAETELADARLEAQRLADEFKDASQVPAGVIDGHLPGGWDRKPWDASAVINAGADLADAAEDLSVSVGAAGAGAAGSGGTPAVVITGTSVSAASVGVPGGSSAGATAPAPVTFGAPPATAADLAGRPTEALAGGDCAGLQDDVNSTTTEMQGAREEVNAIRQEVIAAEERLTAAREALERCFATPTAAPLPGGEDIAAGAAGDTAAGAAGDTAAGAAGDIAAGAAGDTAAAGAADPAAAQAGAGSMSPASLARGGAQMAAGLLLPKLFKRRKQERYELLGDGRPARQQPLRGIVVGFAPSTLGDTPRKVTESLWLEDERTAHAVVGLEGGKPTTVHLLPDEAIARWNGAADDETVTVLIAGWQQLTDERHDAVLAELARWLRIRCDNHGIPPFRVNVGQWRAGASGLHGAWDLNPPGELFPWERLEELIGQTEKKKLNALPAIPLAVPFLRGLTGGDGEGEQAAGEGGQGAGTPATSRAAALPAAAVALTGAAADPLRAQQEAAAACSGEQQAVADAQSELESAKSRERAAQTRMESIASAETAARMELHRCLTGGAQPVATSGRAVEAAQEHNGPWFLLDNQNPNAPLRNNGKRGWYYPQRGGNIRGIVVHTAESFDAQGVANYFTNVSRPASAHVNVDTQRTVHCLPDEAAAFHASRGNSDGLGIEICYKAALWGTGNPADEELLVRNAAAWCRLKALSYQVPIVRLTGAQWLSGARGFVAHADLDPSRRSDPGPNFPWDKFLELVGSAPPPPTGGSGEPWTYVPSVDFSNQAALNISMPQPIQPVSLRAAAIARHFGFTGVIHGWGQRPGPSDHPKGLGLDFMTMVDLVLGEKIAQYFLRFRDELNVSYVIFNRRIWSRSRGFTERPYSGVSPHLDHPHVSYQG